MKNETSEKLKQEVLDFALENGILEVVFREGDAPTIHNPNPVKISGTITAPSLFIDGKKDEFSDSRSHCLVSITDGTIKLILNEQSTNDKFTIEGKIEKAKKFLELGINDDTKGYDPEKLANKLKLRRNIFPSPADHSNLILELRNIDAKVNGDIVQNDDRRGNTEKKFKQAVQSNVPETFVLCLPLLEGEPKQEIEVSVTLDVKNGTDIVCYLESIDAAEIIESQLEKRVNEEVEKIKQFTTVIYQ